MNGTVSDIQEHFRVKTDGELLSLSSEARDMTPESRLALLAELKRRLDTTKVSATVQLVHGWYTVFVQLANVRFLEICPNCLREPADANIAVTSQVREKRRLTYAQRESVTLKVPYCRECAKKWKYRARLIAWPSYLAIAAWGLFCIWFNMRLGLWLIVLFALPLVSFLRQASAVRLGNFDGDWLEFRFRSPDYAEKFASANEVLAQNTETIGDDFLAAIESVQAAGEANPISGDFYPPER